MPFHRIFLLIHLYMLQLENVMRNYVSETKLSFKNMQKKHQVKRTFLKKPSEYSLKVSQVQTNDLIICFLFQVF